jgi:hypothetical protein
VKPRRNRRRQIINLALMGLWLLGAAAFSALASVGHHWWLLIPAAFGLPEGLLGTAEDMTKLDLEGLGVPKRAKPADLVASSPPGSVLHRTALHAVRLHRSERLAAVAISVAGFVAWAATAWNTVARRLSTLPTETGKCTTISRHPSRSGTDEEAG